MSECPFCRRRLLSTASPSCNWCGKEIPDAAYQQRAAAEREAFHVQQALHDAASLAAIEGLSMGGPWFSPLDMLRGPQTFSRPVLRPFLPAEEPAPPAEIPAPEETTDTRFRHLEL